MLIVVCGYERNNITEEIWAEIFELWAGKYKTTGRDALIITNLQGRVTFVSEPVPDNNKRDMAKLKESAIANLKT